MQIVACNHSWRASYTSTLEPCFHSYTRVSSILVVACSQKWTKVGILNIFWYQVYQAVFYGRHCFDKLRQFVNVFLSIIFKVTIKFVFHGSFCTFRNCSLILTHCRVNTYSLSLTKTFWTLQQIFFLCPPKFSCFNFSVIVVKMYEPSVWIPLFSFLLHPRSYQTDIYKLVGALQRYYLWIVYQLMTGPYTKFIFWISETLFFEFTLCRSKFGVQCLWLYKVVSHLILIDC